MISLIANPCNSQIPVFNNYKASNQPFLQFNDVVLFQSNILFITNNGIYKKQGETVIPFILKEDLSKFISAQNQLFVYTIYGEIFELKQGLLIQQPFNSLLKKKLNNSIINQMIYSDSTFYISNVIGNIFLSVDLKTKSLKTVEMPLDASCFVKQIKHLLISGTNQSSNNKTLSIQLDDNPFTLTLAENNVASKTNVIALQDHSYLFTKQHEAIRFNQNKVLNRLFTEKNIEDVFQDGEGNIWYAFTNGGIVKYKGYDFNTNNNRYLGNKTVLKIYQDKNKNLWFCTSGSGVFELKSTPKLQYKTPQIFSKTNGEKENIIGKLTKNKLLKASDFGSQIIDVNKAKQDTMAPIVFVNNIKINGIDTTPLPYFELAHYQNNIEFFTGGKNVTTVSFKINPPLWMTFWFVSTMILLVAAITLVLSLIYIKNHQKHKRKEEEDKKKALTAELQALRAQMNPHFIFNTLASIQNYITQNNTENAVVYLSKFAKLMRATLENTKKQKITIKDEIESLELYLQLEQLRLNNKFDFKIEIDDKIDVQFDLIPAMLLQPFIENAIWHGISHLKTKGTINISLQLMNENTIKCIILDNGVGRKFTQSLQKERKSFGINITKNRLQILNSLSQNKVEFSIHDLEENGKPTGTEVVLIIPL